MIIETLTVVYIGVWIFAMGAAPMWAVTHLFVGASRECSVWLGLIAGFAMIGAALITLAWVTPNPPPPPIDTARYEVALNRCLSNFNKPDSHDQQFCRSEATIIATLTQRNTQ